MGGNHDDRVTSKPQPQEQEEDFLSAENLVRLGPLFLAGDNDGGGARRDRSSPPPTPLPPPSHQIEEPESCCVVEENHQPKHPDAKKNALRRSFNQRPVDPVVTVAMGRNGRPNLVYTLNDPLHPPSSPISLVEMKQVLKLDRQNLSTSRRLWSVSSASFSSIEVDPETTLVDLDPTNSTASTTTTLLAWCAIRTLRSFRRIGPG